jgi:hypothetical protein
VVFHADMTGHQKYIAGSCSVILYLIPHIRVKMEENFKKIHIQFITLQRRTMFHVVVCTVNHMQDACTDTHVSSTAAKF